MYLGPHDMPAQYGDGLLALSAGAAAVFFLIVYFDQIVLGVRQVARLLNRSHH